MADARTVLLVDDYPDALDVSGFDVARELRSHDSTRQIPIIAATGHSHVAQHEKARESGFDAVVVKPCDPDTLVVQIHRLLASSGAWPAASIEH